MGGVNIHQRFKTMLLKRKASGVFINCADLNKNALIKEKICNPFIEREILISLNYCVPHSSINHILLQATYSLVYIDELKLRVLSELCQP